MHTEIYCETLENLDRTQAVRAMHLALLQLGALTVNADCGAYDNIPTMTALRDCLVSAGHVGFETQKS